LFIALFVGDDRFIFNARMAIHSFFTQLGDFDL
jgi:hypothetical protein